MISAARRIVLTFALVVLQVKKVKVKQGDLIKEHTHTHLHTHSHTDDDKLFKEVKNYKSN